MARTSRITPHCCMMLALLCGGAPVSHAGGKDEVPVRGVVRPLHQATLSTSLRAPVVRIAFREGERFAKGDVLVAFDCRPERASLAAAKALRKERAVGLKGARYLQGMKAGSVQDVQIAEAQVEQADAEIASIEATLDRCEIEAPFDGVVYETHIRENETPAEGAPVISIVDPASSEIELIISSDRVNAMAKGREFEFRVDETGEVLRAAIRRTAPMIDPASQTIKIYGQFAGETPRVLPGMSGDAVFDSHWALR